MFVCVFVCLSVRYAFGQSTCQCSQTFQESSSHPGEGRGLLFSRKIQVLPPLPKDPPRFPTNEITVVRFQKEDKSL